MRAARCSTRRRAVAAAVAVAVAALATRPAAADQQIRKILDFDNYVDKTTIPAKNPGPLLTPSKCRTVTYLAGPDEIAVVTVSGTVTPSVPTSGNLNLVVTRSLPLQPFVSVNIAVASESLDDGTASVRNFARIPLAEGFTYQFGAGFSGDQAFETSTFACQGVVTIHRTTP